jgi:hypothetical protein
MNKTIKTKVTQEIKEIKIKQERLIRQVRQL